MMMLWFLHWMRSTLLVMMNMQWKQVGLQGSCSYSAHFWHEAIFGDFWTHRTAISYPSRKGHYCSGSHKCCTTLQFVTFSIPLVLSSFFCKCTPFYSFSWLFQSQLLLQRGHFLHLGGWRLTCKQQWPKIGLITCYCCTATKHALMQLTCQKLHWLLHQLMSNDYSILVLCSSHFCVLGFVARLHL